MSIIDRVKGLGLPLDQLIVIGSGLLDAMGIRRSADVDLAVEDELFERLKSAGSWQVNQKDDVEFLVLGNVEIWPGWEDGRGRVSYQQLIEDSVVIDGVRFVSLDYLLTWKEWRSRDKDIADIELIKAHRAGSL